MGHRTALLDTPEDHHTIEHTMLPCHGADAAFVGREDEMQALLLSLDATARGQGQLVFFSGEAGIGKTRMVLEFATVARSHGAQVLLGHGIEETGMPPFWPWIQIVRVYLATHTPDVIQAAMGRGAAEIAQVIPEVKTCFPDLPPLPRLDSRHARFRLFESVATFLANAALVAPLVLIVDDLPWVDTPSLRLLQFLARHLAAMRVMVVGTYREMAWPASHPFRATLDALVREPVVASLVLHGLSEQAVAQCLERTTGVPPPAALVRALYQRTEGHPFFLTELLRCLSTTETAPDPHQPQVAVASSVPRRVCHFVSQRLQALSADCQHFLRIAAIVGHHFRLPVVTAVAAQAHPPVQRPLLDVLDEALAARLITEVPPCLGHYRFAHALIREALHEDLSLGARVRLHQQVGEALEQLYRPHLAPHLSELAAHFLAAAQGGVAVEQAITYTLQAAHHATAVLAYEEAVQHYTQALHLLEVHPQDATAQCEVLLALGDAQRQAGLLTDARKTCQRAAGLAKALGSPEHLARAALGFATGFAGISVHGGVPDVLVIGLLEEALRALPPDDSALRARVLGRLAMELYWSSPRERRATLCQQAVAMARRLDDPATLASTLHAVLIALRGPEHPEERLATAAEIIALATTIGDKELVLRGSIWRVVALLELGDIQAVEQEMIAYAQHAEELRQPLYLWVLLVWQAMRAEVRGDFAGAERLAQQALALGQQTQDADALQCYMVQRFGIRAGKQSLHEVERPTRELATQYTSMPGWRSALTLLYASMGREAEARQEFEAFAVNDFAGVPRNAYWLVTLTNLAQACVILRDVSRAAHLYQLLLPFAAQYVVVPPGLLCVGAVARFLGLLAMLQQRWEESEAHFTAAVQRNTLLGAPPKVAITQRCYAAMLIARQWPGDREQAIALLHEALATSQSLGMDEQVRHVRGLLEQAQAQCTAVTPTSALTPPAQRPTYVFRQEGDYWTIRDNATLFRLKHVRGLPYLRHLLQHPHQEVHVFDLVALAQASTSCAAVAPPPFARGTPPHRGDLGDAGDVLDVQARTAYKQRLHELQAELQVAQDTNDLGRQTLVQEEIEMLLQQLSAAVGLGGRSRHAASPAERARINVTNGIRMALTKMAAHSPPLVQYLTTTIKTGLICSYTPLPHAPILWEF